MKLHKGEEEHNLVKMNLCLEAGEGDDGGKEGQEVMVYHCRMRGGDEGRGKEVKSERILKKVLIH